MNLEERAVLDLAILFKANLETDAPLMEYAIITCAIRHYLKGVCKEVLQETIEGMADADHITINIDDEILH